MVQRGLIAFISRTFAEAAYAKTGRPVHPRRAPFVSPPMKDGRDWARVRQFGGGVQHRGPIRSAVTLPTAQARARARELPNVAARTRKGAIVDREPSITGSDASPQARGEDLDVATRLIDSESAGFNLTWNSSSPRPMLRAHHPGENREKLWSGY
jgi:hypothetical protein